MQPPWFLQANTLSMLNNLTSSLSLAPLENIWHSVCYYLYIWVRGVIVFFLFRPHLWHMKVPWTGIKFQLQLQPMPQLQQCRTFNQLCRACISAVTCASTETLCHSRNSCIFVLCFITSQVSRGQGRHLIHIN